LKDWPISKLVLLSLLTVEDVHSILEITDRLKVDGQFGWEGFQSQQFIFQTLNFFKYQKKDILCLPFNTLVRFQGASQKSAGRMRSFCLGSGIITIARSASIEEHRGTSYKLNYQFKQGQAVSSFINGLIILYTREQLQEIYVERIYKKYIADQ
jgi:hypothetical protein